MTAQVTVVPGTVTVIAGHGSYLTCNRRLGCTSTRHLELRRAYSAARLREWRDSGSPPSRRGRTHGTRATYRICTAGPDGGKCSACKAAETSYRTAYRHAGGR